VSAPPWLAALEALYARLDEEIAAAGPRCALSGRCCDFSAGGHRLMASTLETAYARARAGGRVPEAGSGTCPWHVDGLCTLRDGRPLGCRVYFCDPAYSGPMPRLYEAYHSELRALHERHGVPYRYGAFVEDVRRDPEPPPTPGPRPGASSQS